MDNGFITTDRQGIPTTTHQYVWLTTTAGTFAPLPQMVIGWGDGFPVTVLGSVEVKREPTPGRHETRFFY